MTQQMKAKHIIGKKRKSSSEKESRPVRQKTDDSMSDIVSTLGDGDPFHISSSNIYSKSNHVYFYDDITYESAFSLNKELREAEMVVKHIADEYHMKPPPIYLHITTYGGYIHAAFSIIDCIQSLSVPVYTVVDGYVASAGTLISLAGKKRYIMKNAYMLVHELRSAVWGKMSAIEDEFTNLKKTMDHIVRYYKEKTNLSKKELRKILKKDINWNADECIAHNLVDAVYE